MSTKQWKVSKLSLIPKWSSCGQESVGDNNHPAARTETYVDNNELVIDHSFDEFDKSESKYLEELALLHEEHLWNCNEGFISGKEFWPEAVEDVYNVNTYTMSCFYYGHYPFDLWEEEYDSYLYVQVCEAAAEDDHENASYDLLG